MRSVELFGSLNEKIFEYINENIYCIELLTFDLFVASGATGDPAMDQRTSFGSLARLVTVLVIELTSTLGVIIGVTIPDLKPENATWLVGVSGTSG